MENKELSLWYKIQLFWEYDLKYYPSRFLRGVKNLIEWFPIIWEDRDYDSQYLMDLMKFKIEKMYKYQDSLNSHTSTQRNVEIMKTVVKLMDKVQEETYRHEYYDYIDSEFEFVKVEGTKYSTFEEKVTRDDTQEYIKKYPLTYRQITSDPLYKSDVDERIIPMIMGNIRHEKAKRLLYTLMERNVEKWWE
jgi:hypothetical protein